MDYQAVHRAVIAERGRAIEYQCVTGCGRQAKDWAWQHTGPTQTAGAFSWGTNPSDYQPMCKPCHATFDNRWRAERGMADAYQPETVERELRIEAESRRKHADWTADLIARGRESGMSWERIAEAAGLSRMTVIRIHQKGSTP